MAKILAGTRHPGIAVVARAEERAGLHPNATLSSIQLEITALAPAAVRALREIANDTTVPTKVRLEAALALLQHIGAT